MRYSTPFKLWLICTFLVPFVCQAQVIDTLVNVGNHKLHFNITKGEGIPILFESGGGNDGTIWNPLIEPIHKITGTTLITYDRPGYGQSELNPDLPDDEKSLITNGIKDLEKGLELLGYDGEIILVSHSYGGFYSQLYTSRHPEKVKGIVFIDASLSCFYTESFIKKTKAFRTTEWLQNIKSQSLALYYECLANPETIEIMSKVQIPTSTPVIDLVAENPPDFNESDNPEDKDRWISCHENFAKESPNREFIKAYECYHYIHYSNPGLAVNAIVKMYSSHSLDYKEMLQRSLDYNTKHNNIDKQQEHVYWHSERETNLWGYNLYHADKIEEALLVFKLNTMLFPEGYNTWDSYGEVLLETGKKEKAIEMYRKSIEVNPDHEDGKKALNRILNNK